MPTNRWDDEEAARWPDLLGQRVYTSRLLGRDADLVLHGGGNTSVKDRRPDIFGDGVDVLYVKGSGSDLSEVDREGFAGLRLDAVRRLADLPELSDTDMAEQLEVASVVAGGPAPSVEAILHAILPARFVDHTHADAVVTLTNTPAVDELLDEVYGDEVVVIPYVMPGFKLAHLCAQRVDETQRPGVIGMVLKNHGIFTWGDDAQESYDRMIDLVGRAEHRLAGLVSRPSVSPGDPPSPVELAELRARISEAAGAPFVLSNHRDEDVMAFVARDDLATIAQQGTVTPDHVIRTKPWPLLGRDVAAFAARYRRYFEHHRSRATTELHPLDPAPRVVLDPGLGMCCAGRTIKDAAIAEDVYRHTMKVILYATALGGFWPVTMPDLFDVEYWELEQAKLRRKGDPPPLAGEVALVTGAASGIGQACAAALMEEGAAVVGLDVTAEIKAVGNSPQWLGIEADITDEQALRQALEQAVGRFGGLDMLVLNAGVFPASARIAELDLDGWRRVMAVNLDANVVLLREAHPLLKLAPRSGRVVVIGSRNAPAPGPGAAAYSASKAALTQLARVTALEWAEDGIRVNVIHPDAVFDTAIWTDEVLTQRAANYGMTVEEYRTKNLLGVEVTSADVARLCVAMCGPAFAKTTGAQVPVDGGNDRVL